MIPTYFKYAVVLTATVIFVINTIVVFFVLKQLVQVK